MHVTMCPRLFLMYAIPLVSGLNTLNTQSTPITLNTLNSLIIPITLNIMILHSKKEGMPESTPSNHLKPIPRYQALGPAYLVFLI